MIKQKCSLCFLVVFPIWLLSANAQDAETSHGSVGYQQGKVYYDSGKYEKAIPFYKSSADFYEKSRSWSELIEVRNQASWCLINLSQYDSALIWTNKTLKLTKNHLPITPEVLSSVYDLLGYINRMQSKLDQSMAYHQKAISLLLSKYDSTHFELANSYHFLGTTLLMKASFDEAGYFLDKSLKIKLNSNSESSLSIADSYRAIGMLYDEQGNFDLTLDYYQKSMIIRQQIVHDQHPELIKSYVNLSSVYTNLYEYKKANEYLDKIIEISERFSDDNTPILADAYTNKAIVYYRTGDYGRSVEYFKRALDIQQKTYGELSHVVAQSYSNIGAVYGSVDQYELAIPNLEKALQINTKLLGKHHYDLSFIFNNLGLAYSGAGDYTKSLEAHLQALKIRILKFGDAHTTVALSYNNMAITYEDSGDYETAITFHLKALAIRKQFFDKKSFELSQSYSNLGNCYFELNDYESALRYYQQHLISLIPDFDNEDWLTNPTLSESVYNTYYIITGLKWKANCLKSLYLQKHNTTHLKSALSTYLLTNEYIQMLLESDAHSDTKAFVMEDIKGVYKGAAETLRLLKRETHADSLDHELFTISESNRASLLSSAFRESEAKEFAGIPDSLLQKEVGFKKEISDVTTEIELLKTSGTAYDTAEVFEKENQLFGLNRRQEDLIALFEENYPKYHQLKYQSKIENVTGIQQIMPDESLLIEYLIGENTIFIFTITKTQFNVIFEPLPDDFEILIADLRTSLSDESQIEQSVTASRVAYASNAYRLYELLLAKALEHIDSNTQHLLIVPDGVLATIPFEVLISEQVDTDQTSLEDPNFFRHPEYLISKYDISYAYSANYYHNQVKRDHHQQKPQALFGGFSADYKSYNGIEDTLMVPMVAQLVRSGRSDLPGAESEVMEIAKMTGGDAWLRNDATEANFKLLAANYQFLHFAMHGLFDDEHPSLSKLLFTPVDPLGEDSYLHASEIYATPINADMVVLSACNSGFGALREGEGIMSLSRAFSYAGCPSVVNSLWNAQDETTSSLMIDFYKGLLQGANKAASLRQAKLNYIKSAKGHYLHPYFWSSFIINGNVSPVKIENPNHWYWWVIGACFALIAFLLLKKFYPTTNQRLSKMNGRST